jgi:3-deoxy-manno-octulosonate cytidylyltransferase (CMP-KDO synthetase)
MPTAILIPARYNSSRFPGKMLADMGNGKTLIEHVYAKCIQTGFDTYVLTDHEDIAAKFKHDNVVMQNSAYHIVNGTERCKYTIRDHMKFRHYSSFINVQGDMPDITPDIIIAVRRMLKKYSVATAYTDLAHNSKKDPNTVKAIVYGDELEWCGRGFETGWHHLGIYGYSREALLQYPELMSNPESRSSLEQLRWLDNTNIEVGAVKVQFGGLEINTPEDLSIWKLRNGKV